MDKRYKLPLIIAFCHIPLLMVKSVNEVKQKKQKIAIKTIQLQETKLHNFSSHIAAVSKPPPIKKPKRKKQMPPKKKVAKKKSVKKTKKKVLKKPQKKKIAKKIAKKSVKKPAKKMTRVIKKPAVKPTKNITAKISNGKKDAGKKKNDYNEYLQQISAVFTDFLVLPEKGRVSLEITITKDKVSKIVPLSFESKKNLSYLQKNLPKLSLPCKEQQETIIFTLVFSDEK